MILQKGHISKEINDFFSEGGGKSIILKGCPGTGKTTFALEVLNHFRSIANVCFVSSRIDEHALKKHIKWIDFDLLLSKGNDEGSKSSIEGIISRKELNRMESRVEEGDEFLEEDLDGEKSSGCVEGNTWTFDITSILPEIDCLYDTLEAAKKDMSLIAIDSIDSLGEKYGISPRRLLKMLQKDLVERSGVNVIFILETSHSNQMEYIGDGVISLEMEDISGRRLRSMKIEKLRGQQIMMPSIPFTLKGGHFNCFDYNLESMDNKENKTAIETIIPDIAEPGKYTLFEFDRNVPAEYVDSIIKSVIDSITGRFSIYSTPSVRLFGHSPARFVKNIFGVDYNQFKFISPVTMLLKGTESDLTVRVDSGSFYSDFDLNFISDQFGQDTHHAFLMDANQIISHYGQESMKDIELHISGLLQKGGICFGFSWPSSNPKYMDMGISNRLVKISCINSQWTMHTEKPTSPFYMISPGKDNQNTLEFKVII